MTRRPRIVVVGAGIAGLTAARTLSRAGVDVIVLERDAAVGGRVRTRSIGGAPVDVGAQFVAPFAQDVIALVQDVGLGPSLQRQRQTAAVVHGGRAWPLTTPRQLLCSPLLPLRARAGLAALGLRVLARPRRLDPNDLTRAAALDDETADAFVRRWAGTAAAERFVAPVVRALLYWDLKTTSRAVLMTMLRMAIRHRQVVLVEGGCARLPASMASELDVRLGAAVVALEPCAAGTWTVRVAGDDLSADGIVCATTATVARRLTAALPAATATRQYLDSVTYTRTAVVVAAVPGSAPLPPASLVFTDEAQWLACVNPPTAVAPPAGDRYVQLFLSDDGAAALGGLDDAALAEAALDAVRAAVPGERWATAATPLAVTRWDEALPRFDVGALRDRARHDPASIDVAGLVFAGDHLGGPSLGGAHASGQSAARRLLAQLGRR